MVREPVLTRKPSYLESSLDYRLQHSYDEEEEEEDEGHINEANHINEQSDPDTGDSFSRALHSLQNTIPAEVITLWAGIQGAILLYGQPVPNWLYWLCFGITVFAVPPYLLRTIDLEEVDDVFGIDNVYSQCLLAAGAFTVWVYYLGGPFEAAGLYDPLAATLMIFLYPVAIMVVPFYLSIVINILRRLSTAFIANRDRA